jgi:hypothetical protein
MFPGDLQDFLNGNGKIWSFLVDLRNHKFIQYHGEVIKEEKVTKEIIIKAAIQPKGKEYLKSENPNPMSAVTSITVKGSGNKILSHSPSSSADDSSTAQRIKNTPNKISTILKNWKLVIIIILGLLAIWKGCVAISSSKKSSSSKKQSPIINPEVEFWTISKLESPTDSFQRHLTPLDMAINEFLKPKNFRFKIYCFAADPESFAYAKEFYEKLICDNRSFYKSSGMSETVKQLETNHYVVRDEYFIIFTSESELEIRIKPRPYHFSIFLPVDSPRLDFTEKASVLIPDSIVFKNNVIL